MSIESRPSPEEGGTSNTEAVQPPAPETLTPVEAPELTPEEGARAEEIVAEAQSRAAETEPVKPAVDEKKPEAKGGHHGHHKTNGPKQGLWTLTGAFLGFLGGLLAGFINKVGDMASGATGIKFDGSGGGGGKKSSGGDHGGGHGGGHH